MWHHNRIHSVQNKGTHLDISEIFWFINNLKPYWLNANYWIISVESSTNPSQSQFNHFEDAKPLFRHMVTHSPFHARSRANFIKRESQRPKFCTEARDSVLKPVHTIGGCRSSPKARSQRWPWFSRPAIVASSESHILLDSARFKDLIIRWFKFWG